MMVGNVADARAGGNRIAPILAKQFIKFLVAEVFQAPAHLLCQFELSRIE